MDEKYQDFVRATAGMDPAERWRLFVAIEKVARVYVRTFDLWRNGDMGSVLYLVCKGLEARYGVAYDTVNVRLWAVIDRRLEAAKREKRA